ncbi:MAG: glycoside hydrolase family 88 protein [Bacteroidales bacterium]
MKRVFPYRVLAFTLYLLAAGQAMQCQLPSRAGIIHTLIKVNGYWMNSHLDPGDNEWDRAAYFTGNMGLYQIYPDPAYLDYALKWAMNNEWGLKGGPTTRHADNQCAGQTYLDLYEIDPEPERIADIQNSIESMVNSQKKDDWWWIDAFYMAMPVFTRLGVLNEDSLYFEKLYALYTDTKSRRGLYDEDAGLWFRDENFDPPYTTPNGKNCYWSRGNGWVFAAHVRTLQYLPEGDPHRDEYISTFQSMSEALKEVQRTDGFWNVSLADPDDYGGPETSGTSFFTYGLAWGINNGLLDSVTYYPVVEKAWHGLSTMAVHEDGFLGYVQNVGKEPGSSQPVTGESTADFGVGAFLLAGSEVYRLAPGELVEPPEEGENIALGKLMDYSDQQAENRAENVTDGNILNRWSAQFFPQWVEIDLGGPFYVTRSEIVPYKNRAYQYMISCKNDPEDFYTVLVDRLDNTEGGSMLTDTINHGPIRYMKLTVTGCHDYTGDWVSIMEFRVYGEPVVTGLRARDVSSIRLYPNPATDRINLQLDGQLENGVRIEMINIQGKRVFEQEYSYLPEGSVITIPDISGVAEGIYLLQIKTRDQIITEKIIVN